MAAPLKVSIVAPPSNVQETNFSGSHKTEFRVAMTCSGCANAVRGVLGKIDGVHAVDIDVPSQKVVVTGSAPVDVLLAAIKKTGKQTTLVART